MASKSDETEGASRDSAEELLHKVRMGDLSAAYELLGRQAPMRTWREALDHIARAPKQADVEAAAHRALRRPEPVVAGLLDVVDAVHSPKAAHVAHAVSLLRAEDRLVQRAAEVRADIQESTDLDTLLAADDGLGALYLVLCKPLSEQRDAMAQLSIDDAARELVVGTLDAEYQRLLELGRTVRWTSGSYRYFLRHSLADLALVADTGGRTWDLAYRLLQQQVENPQENRELIDALPEGTRRRYFAWGLDRDNAGQHLERTRFILGETRRHPADVERNAVVGVLKVDDRDTRAEALISAVTLLPEASDVDREIAEYLATANRAGASRLATAILDVEPSRLRPDLLSADNRALVAEISGERGPDLARCAAGLIPELRDADAIRGAVDMLDQLDQRNVVSTELYAEVALNLMRRTDEDSRWQATLNDLLASSGVLRGAWQVLTLLGEPARTREYRSIVDRTDPQQAGRGTARVLKEAGDVSPALLSAVLDAFLSSALDLEELRSVPEAALKDLAAQARVQMGAMERGIEEARDALGKGHENVEQQLRQQLRPIVERAIDRAEGNDRLAAEYRRLLPSGSDPTALDLAGSVPPSFVPEAAQDELQRIGAQLRDDEAMEIDFSESSDEAARLRYLAALDKRARTADPAWSLVLGAYVSALGRTGDARLLVTDLFERGQKMKLMLGLSSSTRELLVRAAVESGLDVPDEWVQDDTLGAWLMGVLGRTGEAESPAGASVDAFEVLLQARTRALELGSLRERADRLQHDAKLAFVSACRPVFDDLELTIDGYVQLWRALAGLGISQVEPLGSSVDRGDLDGARHEIVGATSADAYIVRAAGIAVDDEIVAPARVERAEV